MLDLKRIQKQPEVLAKALKDRHSSLTIEEFQKMDAERRAYIAEVEELKSRRNQASQEVARMKRAGQDATALLADLGELSARIKALDVKTDEARARVEDWLMGVPNIPDASVPLGRDETENVEIARYGTIPAFDFEPLAHWELGARLKGLDFERAARLSGSRFVVSLGWAARLDRALVNFFLDVHTQEDGYIEVIPPAIVNKETMTGTGQLPKFEEDLFKLREGLYLIPTAEVPLTNLHAGEVLAEEDLPRAYTAATPCFRSEAGSAGKDTRGLIRMHQFTKVEMVRFAHPDDSFNQLELMTGHARKLLEKLELPFRQIVLCTGDMGFGSAKTYDIEVWLPNQKTYREISSCSNCIDFQARRANIRFKPKGGKSAYVHTLNGSGLPTGRTIAAIMENGQQKDGTIVLPKVLVPYMGGMEAIEPDSRLI
ncbi:MAG: serine--tRNA ligase [Desulfovibrionaceae bacterium]|nr:serine--tRNA ligase [Desulfovibrionaceae bacterium]